MPRVRPVFRYRARRRCWSPAIIGLLLATPWRVRSPIRESIFIFWSRRSSVVATQRCSDSEPMTTPPARWRSSRRRVLHGVLLRLREVLAVKLHVRREADGALENGDRFGVVT